MTIQDSYTAEEWQTLINTPIAVISAIIGTSPSGPIKVGREIAAAVSAFESSAKTHADNPLIAAVLVELKGHFESYMGKQNNGAEVNVNIMELAQHTEKAVAICRQAAAVLEQKEPRAAGDGYRAWVFSIAKQVAEAAPEGGFFGIGGEQVNAKERSMLHTLATALQVAHTSAE